MKKLLSLLIVLVMLFASVNVWAIPNRDEDEDDPELPESMIFFTNDVHCGIDQGFGYAGLRQVRDRLEAKGYETILVDDGDSIQGESIGTLSRGEAIIDLMNDMKYDVAIPGNHEEQTVFWS